MLPLALEKIKNRSHRLLYIPCYVTRITEFSNDFSNLNLYSRILSETGRIDH